MSLNEKTSSKNLRISTEQLTLSPNGIKFRQGEKMDSSYPIIIKKAVLQISISFVVAAGVAAGVAFSPLTLAKDDLEFDCLIEPEVFVELSSAVDGIVSTILVNKSDFVEKGQVVARLESSVEQATVLLAKKKASSYYDIEAKRTQYEFSQKQKSRAQKLYKKNAVSIDEKQKMETEAKLALFELEKAKINKHLAELELKRAEANLAKRTIRSTITGVVVDRMLEPGESVDDRPILTLAKINPLRVELIAPARLFGQTKPGMKANVFPEHPVGAKYEAIVARVDQIVDAASGSFGISLTLPNPDLTVVGGLNCKLSFINQEESLPIVGYNETKNTDTKN